MPSEYPPPRHLRVEWVAPWTLALVVDVDDVPVALAVVAPATILHELYDARGLPRPADAPPSPTP